MAAWWVASVGHLRALKRHLHSELEWMSARTLACVSILQQRHHFFFPSFLLSNEAVEGRRMNFKCNWKHATLTCYIWLQLIRSMDS
ncbi:hypothetical protein CEXT_625221 [Caerostris extrusa]|uniref:Uncharacterized protein n=1 Tax=Caerostris extrusa TaxID=172846 RepID=A0AAV4NEW1_CAEEX|nr:hypothetical protein CEXT_625221 [Caerostris extrusa]